MQNGAPASPAQEIIPVVSLVYRQAPNGARTIVGVELAGQRCGGVVSVSTGADLSRPIGTMPRPDGGVQPVLPQNIVMIKLECLWPFEWKEEGKRDLLIATRAP